MAEAIPSRIPMVYTLVKKISAFHRYAPRCHIVDLHESIRMYECNEWPKVCSLACLDDSCPCIHTDCSLFILCTSMALCVLFELLRIAMVIICGTGTLHTMAHEYTAENETLKKSHVPGQFFANCNYALQIIF